MSPTESAPEAEPAAVEEPSTAKPAAPKPKPKPRPKAPTPVVLAAKVHHPVKVPVVADLTPEELAAAAAFGEVTDGVVYVLEGGTRHEVGPAEGDEPLLPFVRRHFSHITHLERFHGRLEASEASLSVRDIEKSLAEAEAVLTKPDSVGNLAAFRELFEPIAVRATALRDTLAAEKARLRAEAISAREALVARAIEIAEKPAEQVHWKEDTAELRSLLDAWKEAQSTSARIGKEAEKELWQRFAHARSSFERARKHHFAELDKVNSSVGERKEALAARAEALSSSKDWEGTARAFRDLMAEWKAAGRGRRSTDDALWKRFQTAQEAFFAARREATEAEELSLKQNLGAKESIVREAETLLPIKDLASAKAALRSIQDRFEAAGSVPKPEAIGLNRRMSAVERALREADDSAWKNKKPELEARASSFAQQLMDAIAQLDARIAQATQANEKAVLQKLEDERASRQAMLDHIQTIAP